MVSLTKNKGGRPSKFGSVDQRQLEIIYKAGFTDAQVAEFVGVTRITIENWKVKYPKFFDTLKDWKIEADKKVEHCLYKRAIGYKYDEVTYEKSKIGGLGLKMSEDEIQAVKHTDISKTKIVVKEVVPDTTAQIFWLKNRQPEQWRDKHDHQHSGDVTILYGHREPKSE